MLIDQWITWAEKRYRREQTSRDLLNSVLPLRDLFGLMPARAIGPRKVAEAQKLMATQGKTRQGILKSTGHIRQMIAWGVPQEILKPDHFVAILAMQPLRYGAIDAPESKKVEPVPITLVRATLPYLNDHTAPIVKIQLLTGMRPGEVCRCALPTSIQETRIAGYTAQVTTKCYIWGGTVRFPSPSQSKSCSNRFFGGWQRSF